MLRAGNGTNRPDLKNICFIFFLLLKCFAAGAVMACQNYFLPDKVPVMGFVVAIYLLPQGIT